MVKSNETLNSEIEMMKSQRIEDRKSDQKAHEDILNAVKDVAKEVKALDKKFVLKSNFRVALTMLTVFATIL